VEGAVRDFPSQLKEAKCKHISRQKPKRWHIEKKRKEEQEPFTNFT
jgi:hypothetical protein